MVNQLLTTLSQLFNDSLETAIQGNALTPEAKTNSANYAASDYESFTQERLKARRDWCSAISAQESLLKTLTDTVPLSSPLLQGLIICGPVPVLSSTALANRFYQGIFSQTSFDNVIPLQLPSAPHSPITPPFY